MHAHVIAQPLLVAPSVGNILHEDDESIRGALLDGRLAALDVQRLLDGTDGVPDGGFIQVEALEVGVPARGVLAQAAELVRGVGLGGDDAAIQAGLGVVEGGDGGGVDLGAVEGGEGFRLRLGAGDLAGGVDDGGVVEEEAGDLDVADVGAQVVVCFFVGFVEGVGEEGGEGLSVGGGDLGEGVDGFEGWGATGGIGDVRRREAEFLPFGRVPGVNLIACLAEGLEVGGCAGELVAERGGESGLELFGRARRVGRGGGGY
jgi:hypothetical protein